MYLRLRLRHQRVYAMTRLVLTIGLLTATSLALADDAPRCSLVADSSASKGTVGKVSDTCCRNVGFSCDADSVSEAVLAERPNIVLVVSDDQGYCSYGFMHGVCGSGSGARTGYDCRSNIDCGGGECVSRTSGIGAGVPLRLSEFTCRYRQPPFPNKPELQPCQYTGSGGAAQPDSEGSLSGDDIAFPFHASNFPCTTTNRPASAQHAQDYPTYPVPLTRSLDYLATHGAVFTRAYVGGNSCKPSRPVLLYGKPHRHLLEMPTAQEDLHSIASWLLANNHALNIDPGAGGYWPFMLGKAEVMSESSGGFKGGKEKAKTKVAKYKCAGNATISCADAATAMDGSLGFPYEARDISSTKGVGDAFNIIEGRRLPNVLDRFAIKRNKRAGSSSTIECSQCTHVLGPTGPTEAQCASECTSEATKPFFLWFAPNQPHLRGQGKKYESAYDLGRDLTRYDTLRRKIDGHITQMDQAVGTLVDELKRHCICGWARDPATGDRLGTVAAPVPEKQSLWENTVLVYLTDHGFLLPGAKGLDNENTHRTILMVSEPRHRFIKTSGQPVLSARQYPTQLVHAIDVFRTVLDYAQLGTTADPVEPSQASYTYGRSLKSHVSDIPAPTTDLRDVVYGEFAGAVGLMGDVDRTASRARYLVTREGLLGFCINSDGTPVETEEFIAYDFNAPSTKRKKLPKPCSIAGSDDCGDATCTAKDRCINDPAKLCSTNADCVEVATHCTGGTEHPVTHEVTGGKCAYAWQGSLGDMARPVEPISTTADDAVASRSCSYFANQSDDLKRADVADDCVPEDVDLCRPLMLKVKTAPVFQQDAEPAYAWDITWDPDERHNLLDPNYGDPMYLGSGTGSLMEKFTECLERYWAVDVGSGEWLGSATCDWAD